MFCNALGLLIEGDNLKIQSDKKEFIGTYNWDKSGSYSDQQLQAHLIGIPSPDRAGVEVVPLFLIVLTKVSSFNKSSGIRSFWPSLVNIFWTNCGLKDGMLWASLCHIFTPEVSVADGVGGIRLR